MTRDEKPVTWRKASSMVTIYVWYFSDSERLHSLSFVMVGN